MNVAFREPNESTPALDAIAEALLLPSGIDGVYARTAMFEDAVDGLSALISRHREPRTEVLRFPPVISRRQLEKSGYLKSFPHFLGCVCCLGGPETEVRAAVDRFEAGEDWTPALSPADLVLSPAACYPVYPLARAAVRCRRKGCCSTSPATASGASRRRTSTGCNRSACANMCASARRSRSTISAGAG